MTDPTLIITVGKGRAETLTLNHTRSGRGQSGPFSKLYILKPSAPPPVHLHMDQSQRLKIQFEIIE